MPLDQQVKTGLVEEHRRHEVDTGSPEVQIAILTARITQLTDHLRVHKKDHPAVGCSRWSGRGDAYCAI